MSRSNLPRTLSFLIALAAGALSGCAHKGAPLPPSAPSAPAAAVVAAETPPAAGDLLTFDAAAANRFVRAERGGSIAVRLRIHARPAAGGPRPPVNLALVVDTSGSMEGAPIEDARAACGALLDALSEGDRLAVVAFHSGAEVLLPSTRLTKENMAGVRARIAAMKASGTTDLAGGLSAGLAEVARSFQANGVNRVVLLGDGVPNDEAPVLPLAEGAAQRGITITALGLGLDYNETLMSSIAGRSGGKYHFIKESSSVAQVFSDEVLRLQRALARGATLRLSPGPGVTIDEVIGLPAARQGAATVVHLGDLSEGDERDVIVRLSAAGRRAGSAVELLDAEIAFDTVSTRAVHRLTERAFVSARATSSPAELDQGRDRDVERSAARMSVADKIVRAVAAARAGNVPLGLSLLDAAEKEGKAAAKEFDDAEIAEKTKGIAPLRQSLPSLAAQQPPHPPAIGPALPRPVAGMPAPSAPVPAVVLESQAAAVSAIQGR